LRERGLPLTKLELYPKATKSMHPLFRNSGMHPLSNRPSQWLTAQNLSLSIVTEWWEASILGSIVKRSGNWRFTQCGCCKISPVRVV